MSADEARAARLRALPKIDLHSHFNGSIPFSTVLELARKYDVALSSTKAPEFYRYHDMPSFLAVYELVSSLLRQPEDWSAAVYASLEADHATSGLRYREMFVNTTLEGLPPFRDCIEGMADGITRARADFGVDARIIPAIYRNQPVVEAAALLGDIVAAAEPLIVGIGMDGDENRGAAEQFVSVYRDARAAGLRTTAHAGERYSADEVRFAIDTLQVDRVDHGYAIAQDTGLMREARERGIHFATAWLSTISHYHPDRSRNPLAAMIDADLNLSLGTDDPAMAHSNLLADQLAPAEHFGLSDDYLVLANDRALAASWAPAELRATIESELEVAKEVLQ